MNFSNQLPTATQDFTALMDFMTGFMRVTDANFEQQLRGLLKTKLFYKSIVIQAEHKLADKAFFVAQGLVFAFVYNKDQDIVPFRIFRAGEIALIPESFMNGRSARYNLMACADTRLLEISLTQMNGVYNGFPQAVMLALQIVAGMFEKDLEKQRMLILGRRQSIVEFYNRYPELLRKNTFLFRDMYIARYLHMNPVTFSRLKANLFQLF